MKTSRTRFSLFIAASLFACSFVVTPYAPAQSASPTPGIVVVSSNAQFVVNRVLDDAIEATLTIPRAWLPGENKARIALYESGRPAIIAEAKRTFETVGDTLQTRLRLEIAPGNYELRLVRDDKTRAPFSPVVSFQINGLRREPGAWLLNGSMSVDRNDASINDANAPLFVKGLKRDLNPKAKKVSRNLYTNAPLSWRVLEVQIADLEKPDYDFAALQTRLAKQIADAQASGQRNFLGIVLKNSGLIEMRALSETEKTTLRNSMTRVRQSVNLLAPDAALILEVDSFLPFLKPQIIEVCAPLCDAVVMERKGSDAKSAWIIKMLRRVAEEQPNYDLPIFIKPHKPQSGAMIYDDDLTPQNEVTSQNLDALMSGATGTIEYSNDELQRVFRRNASLFVNSVTIEDIGVLPAPEGFRIPTVAAPGGNMLEGNAVEIYQSLRDIGRIPLVARLPQKDEKKAPPETFLLRVGERITLDTVERLRANIERGVRVYIEGTPRFGEGDAAIKTQWEQIVGGAVEPLRQSGEKISRPSTVTLGDMWTFGAHSGATLRVQQENVVTLGKATLANRAKTEKGVDVLTAPRVLATTEDNAPALILNAVGKGQVLWMPHRVLDVRNAASHSYYEAIAAQVQSGLVTLRDENDQPLTTPVRVALRRSPKGALMLALFNPTAQAAKLRVSIEGIAAVALDLATEAELTIDKSGNQSTFATTIAANDWKLIALGGERKAFDQERNAPLFPVKIK